MTDASIFEKLTLGFLGDIALETLDAKDRYIYSVMNNIERILNTRRGSIKHVANYGLPDLSVIYRHLPSSLSILQKYITFTLLKYEPRLLSIQIQMIESKSTDFIIAYELVCQLKEIGFIRFKTTFDGDESVRVSW